MKSAFEELKEAKAHLVKQLSEDTCLKDFQASYTEIIDQYFRASLEESETGRGLFKKKRPFTFVAVGGYGRKELCLHSDIDIIILFSSKIPAEAKDLAEEIFFPLWNLGLDLGYGVRTMKDCLSLCRDDFEVLTSMMDSRFICGDSPLYLSLMENLQKKVVVKKSMAFTRWLDDQNKIRMDKFGDASYLLEPHLKEGIGGLRDYHHILWIARTCFDLRTPRDLEYYGKLSHNEYRELEEDLMFIWLVRNHLHLISGRKNDQLHFDYQEKIAEQIGFKNKGGLLAVERFLGKLHSCMASIKSLHKSFINTHLPKRGLSKKRDKPEIISNGLTLYQDEIYFDSSTAILSNPFLLLEIFEKCSVLCCRLSLESMRLLREFLYLVDDTFRASEKATQLFLTIINNKYTFEALDQMFETGFLEVFIPEFGEIKDRVQFDAYHMFPVGRHSLETVRQLKELANRKELLLHDLLLDLADPQSIFLAAFLHDIGKKGKDHSRKGKAIATTILKRLGYDKKKTEDILFLIRHHLLLAETATRRDLNDEKIVVTCSRTIRDVERLKMLYLLTWADSKATGPKAWNEWISNLVQELFFKIMHILEGKELATAHASQKGKNTQSQVRGLVAGKISAHDLDKFFEVMTPRYLLNSSPHDIVRHISMVEQLGKTSQQFEPSAFVIDTRQDSGDDYWELVFSAKDRPGLFSDLSGVLAINNINILSADIYTWRDGTALDIFQVSRPLDPIHPEETWQHVERDLKNTFKGKLSLAYRLGQKAEPSILSDRKKPSRPPKVIIDNESSDFFTLIEVFADDRVGLLYDITHTLFELRLDIRIAIIATKVDQIADVFYVRDLEGQKVKDEDQLKEIKEALDYKLGLT